MGSIECPICSRDLSDTPQSARERHVDSCLSNPHHDDAGAADSYFCTICAKDITVFNTARRAAHMNRCLDVYIDSIPDAPPEGLDRIESCPGCHGSLVDLLARRKLAHIKLCARNLLILPGELVVLFRTLQSAPPPAATSTSTHVPSSKPSTATATAKPRAPRSLAGAKSSDLALALTLSASLSTAPPSAKEQTQLTLKPAEDGGVKLKNRIGILVAAAPPASGPAPAGRKARKEKLVLDERGAKEGFSSELDQLRDLIVSNTDLYSRLLMYEPVDFHGLYRLAHKHGIKISRKNLAFFLDGMGLNYVVGDGAVN
ncbi:hypothetical protein M427DRAFT_156328 [Gonapodya prolifera JEL478]|uniref:Structure-specific endonuclease subunit SLX4 n=1 Tax=Gonapodya prolifera (strain JEL478) TaxID=1344416 RepID=A0A139AB15_GONPJ|nr:hypothetical protein M427DRAFT_156328 [Gonapodya prolifera JEL478]|eukprot:KXS13898.1 hypothetical protein M427DRAFT_156328 [Gonapodya prolifera JEL478]